MQKTSDNKRWMAQDPTTKVRTLLWGESRLELSPGFDWGPGVSFSPAFSTRPLDNVSFSQDPNVSARFVSSLNETVSVPAGVSRFIAKIDSSQGTYYYPIRHVCQDDHMRSRILNHVLEDTTKGVAYETELDGSGWIWPKDHFYEIKAGSLPSGLTLQQQTDPSIDPNTPESMFWGVYGTTNVIGTSSVIFKQSQAANYHYRRLDLSVTSALGVQGSDGSSNLVLSDKLVFLNTDLAYGPEAEANSYGLQLSTQTSGASTYLKIMGGVAPYRIAITNFSVVNSIAPGLKAGSAADGRKQIHLGFTSSRENTPLPTEHTAHVIDPVKGTGWTYVVPTGTAYLKSFSVANSGFDAPYSTLSGDLANPSILRLSVSIVDSAGSPKRVNATVDIRLVPFTAIPSIKDPVKSVTEGQVYEPFLQWNGSTTLTGLLYSDLVASGTPTNIILNTDQPWWKPVLTQPTPGNFQVQLKSVALLTQSANVTANLKVRCVTYRHPQYPNIYDYVTVSRPLSSFQINPRLGLQRPTNQNVNFYVGETVNLVFSAIGGTPNPAENAPSYKWGVGTTNSPIVVGVYNTGITGIYAVPSPDGKQLHVSGVRQPRLNEVFPQNDQFSVYLEDYAVPAPSSVTMTPPQDLRFEVRDAFSITVNNPIVTSDFMFYVPASVASTYQLGSSRDSYPWANTTSFDYVNDFSASGRLSGYFTTLGSVPHSFNMEVRNTSCNVWKSFKYGMPLGLSFAIRQNPAGGYQDGFYQVNRNGILKVSYSPGTQAQYVPLVDLEYLTFKGVWNAATNSPSIPVANNDNRGWYYRVTTAGSSNVGGITSWQVGDWVVSTGTSWMQVTHAEAVSDLTNKVVGFKASKVLLKDGDLMVASLTKRGGVLDQFWEIGYEIPHFELISSQNEQPQRDSYKSLGLDPLGVGDCSIFSVDKAQALTRFNTLLSQKKFDQSNYDVIPHLQTGFDTLHITLQRDDGASNSVNINLPIAENDAIKFWVAGASVTGSRAYYWLGSNTKFTFSLDSNAQPLWFGVHLVDRLLKKGVFFTEDQVSSSSGANGFLIPQVFSNLVNFAVTNANDQTSLDITRFDGYLRNQQTFIDLLKDITVQTNVTMSDTLAQHGTVINSHIDNPSLDTSTKYFLGGKKATLPNSLLEFSHSTLTTPDRGFRMNCLLKSQDLRTELTNRISAYKAENPNADLTNLRLHLVYMFILIRQNIPLNGTNVDVFYDLDRIVEATGLTMDAVTSKTLRGKAFQRFPVHVVLDYNGNLSTPTNPQSGASPILVNP